LTKVIKFDEEKLNNDIGAKTIRTILSELYKLEDKKIWDSIKKIREPHPAMEKFYFKQINF